MTILTHEKIIVAINKNQSELLQISKWYSSQIITKKSELAYSPMHKNPSFTFDWALKRAWALLKLYQVTKKMLKKKKAGRLTKFGRAIPPNNGIVTLLRAYWKNSVKLVQWREDMAQGGLGPFLWKNGFDRRFAHRNSSPNAFSTKKHYRTNSNQSVIDQYRE